MNIWFLYDFYMISTWTVVILGPTLHDSMLWITLKIGVVILRSLPFSNRGLPSWGPQRCKGKPGELDACIEGAAVSVSQTKSSTSGDSLAASSSEWWSCDHLSTSVIIMFTSRRLKKNLMIVDDCIIFHSLPKPLDTHQAHCWCFPWLLGFVTRIRRHPSGPPSERERCERSHPHQWSAPWWVASASDQQDHGTWVWGHVVPHCQEGRRFMELLRGKMGRQKCIRNAFFPGWVRKCERSLIKNLDKPLSFSTQLPTRTQKLKASLVGSFRRPWEPDQFFHHLSDHIFQVPAQS